VIEVRREPFDGLMTRLAKPSSTALRLVGADAFEDRMNAALGCKTTEMAMGLLQIVDIQDPHRHGVAAVKTGLIAC